MTSETMVSVGVLLAILAGIVGITGWLAARDKRTSEESEWRGRVDAKLDVVCGISRDVELLQKDMKCMGERVAKVEASASSAHHRLDGMEGKN